MSSIAETHATCPDCGHHGCLTVWANGGSHCHSCGAKKGPAGFSLGEVSEETFSKVIKEYRNLHKKAVDKYKIYTLQNESGEYARLYPYPHNTKRRVLPKDFSDNKGFTNDHLFGMDKFNAGSSKTITIVEGEDDTPAAWQMLGGTNPVVGLPGASISNALLMNCHGYLDSFEQIIVATDGDDAGEKAANRLAAVFPNKVYRVHLTLHNDPMEYLKNKDVAQFRDAWFHRSKYVPDFDTNTPEQFVKVLREMKDDEFVPSGIGAFDKEHLGLFQGHVTLFQAPEGTGKTELFHFFEYHMMTNYPDVPFASLHLEESKKRTILGWASYHLSKNVTRMDLIEDLNEVEEAISDITANENAHLFSLGTDEDPMNLLDRIKYYATVCGCKYIFIEPIQDLAQQYYGPENTERFLSKVAVNLARMATELNIGIVLIGHENDEGLISDCRKLSKQASVVVRLERDIENPDDTVRNTTTLWSKKNRPTSFVGYGGQMLFDPSTFTMEETHE